ncbi:MAG: sulfate permease [Candidatus Omnitrophica bacterium]|nr:sulfate permease [Candidatus Omnitrophota bacterium]
MLKPKILTTLREYSWTQFRSDSVAGIVVGIVALPLAIAFAIASGVSPEKGLFTAIIAGFLISALGGSRVQIGGPTGAFVVIVYHIVQQYGLEGLLLATFLGGILLLIMGLCGFGAAVKFIPYPVIVGFTSGIAVIIFSSQIKDFFGLSMPSVPADFIGKWAAYKDHLYSVNFYASILSLGTLILIVFFRRIKSPIPGSLIAIIISSVLVKVFHWPVETIGSRFGEIPHTLPFPQLPVFDLEMVRIIFPSAVTIALLAGIESLLSAVVSDGMIGGRHRPNMELVAQGLANIGSSLFGGMPATGAIARTTTNVQSGGKTPMAGIIHACVLMMIMFLFGKWAAYIPLACLAGILVSVAYHMSEWHTFRALLRSPKSDVAVLVITFFLTVLFDLTLAIETGIVLSVFLFIRRMAVVTNVGIITRELTDDEEKEDPNAISKRTVPEGVEVYEINGPFFFGASYKFLEAMNTVGKLPKVRIIRMRDVPSMDATGLQALKEEWKSSKKRGIAFLLADVHSQPLFTLERSGFLDLLGEDNVFGNIDDALNRAREILSLPPVVTRLQKDWKALGLPFLNSSSISRILACFLPRLKITSSKLASAENFVGKFKG